VGTIQGDLRDFRGLRKDEFLDRLKVAGRTEVKIIAVAEELESLGGASGVGGANQESVKLDLAGETVDDLVSLMTTWQGE
jgi:hypothetical protein